MVSTIKGISISKLNNNRVLKYYPLHCQDGQVKIYFDNNCLTEISFKDLIDHIKDCDDWVINLDSQQIRFPYTDIGDSIYNLFLSTNK